MAVVEFDRERTLSYYTEDKKGLLTVQAYLGLNSIESEDLGQLTAHISWIEANVRQLVLDTRCPANPVFAYVHAQDGATLKIIRTLQDKYNSLDVPKDTLLQYAQNATTLLLKIRELESLHEYFDLRKANITEPSVRSDEFNNVTPRPIGKERFQVTVQADGRRISNLISHSKGDAYDRWFAWDYDPKTCSALFKPEVKKPHDKDARWPGCLVCGR